MSTRKKGIAIVHNLTNGGAVRVLEETKKILSRRYNITVFTPEKIISVGKTGIDKILEYLKYVYFILPCEYRKISQQINKQDFQAVVLNHDAYTKAPYALLYLKKKSVYILHEPPREFYEPLKFHAPLLGDKLFTIFRLPIFFIDKFLTKRANTVVANSKFSKKRIDNIYRIDSKIIYCGVSGKFHILKKQKVLNTCISVGSLLPYKGHDLTISAIGTLRNKPNFIIVGGGRNIEKKKIRALAKQKRVKLEIFDSLTDKKLNYLFNASTVFINSAFREPFGLSALEAIASGLQVVTVDDGGTKELKKYFPQQLHIVKRDQKSISAGIKDALANRIHTKVVIPGIFKWNNTVNELSEIIEEK